MKILPNLSNEGHAVQALCWMAACTSHHLRALVPEHLTYGSLQARGTEFPDLKSQDWGRRQDELHLVVCR